MKFIKLDTAVLVTKGVLYMVIGAGTPMASSLAQWSNEKQWPDRIQWVIILTGAVVGGATQLLSYLSGSYSDYVKGRAGGTGHDETTQMMLSKFGPGKPTTP